MVATACWRKLWPVLSLAFVVLTATPSSAQYLRVYYPDIEQGSATLVVSPTGQALLVDGGTGLRDVDEGIEHFINDLIDAGVVTSLDYVIATHYDEDHIGRMENVFQYVPLPPSVVTYDRGTFHSVPSTFAYSDYSYGASLNNRITVPVCTSFSLGGGVSVDVTTVNGEVCGASPVTITSASQFENNASVTVVVRYGDVDIWIGGDLTGNIAKGVADVEGPTGPNAGDVDVYTVNHHGSETSSTLSFLNDLKAEVAVNQSSIENSHGHPRATIVSQILGVPTTSGGTPVFIQQNPGDPTDIRSDDSLADYIVDCDDAAAGEVIGLPGTIVLVSNGTSYRMHGCNLPAATRPADAGIGTLGDFPPAIRRVLHTPRVPLAVQSVTVEADIEDVTSAEVRYSLAGVAQTPIAMSPVGGITWSATIPAQLDGVRVEFRVAATDTSAQTELSPEGCYYSGTTTIAALRLNDANGVLQHKTCGARIEGNMTLEPGVLHTFVTQAYVQDATGGLQVFDRVIDGTIARGDSVEWVGELEQFAGQTELNVAEDFGNFGSTRLGAGSAPAPVVTTVAAMGEALEGQLIRINNVSVVSGTIPEADNGSLTISDDGGVSTLSLRVDGTTDIPGANTPTQPFDVIGVASQFDSWVPLTSGYQIVPRERADFLSDEVNHPAVVISEIHADPAAGSAGDANGDGSRSATNDEFIELLNTSTSTVNISNWTLSDAGGVRHTFPANTYLPAREAAVVFGGGTPTGDFGNATANSMVFTASGGSLSLNNAGDTVTLKDDVGTVVQSVSYGSEGNDDQSLVRVPDFSNAPFQKHTLATGSGGSRYSPGTRISGQAFTIPQGAVLLSEVMYDASGADSGLEWIELYNATGQSIDISDMCIGSGGSTYLNSQIQLDGCVGGCTIASGATFVVGGPTSSADNANPTFDLSYTISPGLQNSGADADGVALFNMRCAQVTASTVPVDAVVYGPTNTNSLLDETGVASSPDVGDASGGQTIERTDLAGTWQIQATPTPNTTSLVGGGVNTAPVVTITAPAGGSNFTQGASVAFTGTASDAEDGSLTASLSWSSDLDGSIGSGGSFSTSSLSVGTHSITASVTDSGGLSDSDNISVTIDPPASGGVILSEVFYDAVSGDDDLEWVEIYNSSGSGVNLATWCIGNGGSDYTTSKVQLAGTIPAGATWVIGGTLSNSSNWSPSLDQSINFNPDFQNSGTAGDGVALFDVACSSVTASTVPVDAVVYGPNNSSNLIDESGSASAPEVGDAPSGSSIERTSLAGSWQIQSTPTPNTKAF